jgi:peptide/nickel transport system substrate-binding protein
MPATAPIPQEVAKCFDTRPAGDYGRYVISSGPYMLAGADKLNISSCDTMRPISGFDPTKKLNMVRNPNYDQSTDNLRSNYVDGISVTLNTNTSDIFNRIQSGSLDGSLDSKPPRTTIGQYTTNSSLKNLMHINAGDRTWYIDMNLATPPFDDIHVRKAVNYVIDKAAMQQAWGGSTSGAIATHIMPPEVLNGQLTDAFNPYATPNNGGDLAKAQAEMKQSAYDHNKDGVCDDPKCKNMVLVNRSTTPWTDTEPIVVQSLAKIGIQVKPRELQSAYKTLQVVKNMIPIGMSGGWGKDYADAYSFANALFGSSAIIPDGNSNYSLVGFTAQQAQQMGVKLPPSGPPPSVDTDINNCEKIATTDPSRVTCWADFDKKLMEQVVPWVPYLWQRVVTIVNPSVTKFEFDQFSGIVSFTQIAVNNKISASTLS